MFKKLNKIYTYLFYMFLNKNMAIKDLIFILYASASRDYDTI